MNRLIIPSSFMSKNYRYQFFAMLICHENRMFHRRVTHPMRKSKEKLAEKRQKGAPVNFAQIEKSTIGTEIKRSRRSGEGGADAASSSHVDQSMLKAEMRRVELLRNLDDCIDMAAQAENLLPPTKQMLL